MTLRQVTFFYVCFLLVCVALGPESVAAWFSGHAADIGVDLRDPLSPGITLAEAVVWIGLIGGGFQVGAFWFMCALGYGRSTDPLG